MVVVSGMFPNNTIICLNESGVFFESACVCHEKCHDGHDHKHHHGDSHHHDHKHHNHKHVHHTHKHHKHDRVDYEHEHHGQDNEHHSYKKDDCSDTLVSSQIFVERNHHKSPISSHNHPAIHFNDWLKLITGVDFPIDVGKETIPDPPDIPNSSLNIVTTTVFII